MTAIALERSKVAVLLLGSGWTSRFLLPRLEREGISLAHTSRQPRASRDDGEGTALGHHNPPQSLNTITDPLPFRLDVAAREGEGRKEHAFRLQEACASLPKAQMIVVVFPLPASNDGTAVPHLVDAYEAATGCSPAWLALGSTGAWGKGKQTSSSPVLPSSARAQAEAQLLSLNRGTRPTAVLNLAGLYGHQRNPANFAKRVADTKDKLSQKTSVHLVHGQDVAQAIVGMYRALSDDAKRQTLWGRRWIVTDTHVYDWWQLLGTLQPPPVPQGVDWVRELMAEHNISALPRPRPPDNDGQAQGVDAYEARQRPPLVLERALESDDFWHALGSRPEIGRCDDYGSNGGGMAVEASL